MNKSRNLSYLAALLVALIFSNSAVAQNATITMQVLTLAGANKISPGTPPAVQPAPGVSIYVLVGANKFSTGMPPTGTTNSTGAFVFPQGLLSAVKPHTQMEVYEVCVNGEKAVFVITKGPEDQLPQDTGDCHKRYLGGFWSDGGPKVTVDLANGVVTQTGGGPLAGTPPGNPLVTVHVGGGVGFKRFVSANNCQPVLAVFPSANCSAGDRAAGFNIEAAVGFTRYFAVSGTYNLFFKIKRATTASTFSATDTFRPQFETIVGQVILPIGPLSIFGEGGGAFSQIDLKETQSAGSGGSSSSFNSHLHTNVTGPAAGGGVRVNIAPRLVLQAHYQYIPVQNGQLLSEHNHTVVFGLLYRLK